jgi:hypothetical protein
VRVGDDGVPRGRSSAFELPAEVVQ